MKFFQKRWVAITLCIVMIVAAIGIGQAKNRNTYRPESSSAAVQWGKENYAAYTRFLRDDGNLLSGNTEQTLSSYNGAWDYSYESVCGVATVSSLNGQDMEDLSYDLEDGMGLGSLDCLLLVDKETREWYFVYGDDFGYYVNNELELLFQDCLGSAVTDADKQLPDLFADLSDWYEKNMPVSGQAAQGTQTGLVAGGAVFFVFLIVILIAVAIISAIVRAGRRMVGGFRRAPIFFFGPGPRGPRPPFGPGSGTRPGPGPNPGPRPGSNNRSSGGFGSSSRGGSFNGSRSGGFGSSSRGSGSRPGGGFGSGKR